MANVTIPYADPGRAAFEELDTYFNVELLAGNHPELKPAYHFDMENDTSFEQFSVVGLDANNKLALAHGQRGPGGRHQADWCPPARCRPGCHRHPESRSLVQRSLQHRHAGLGRFVRDRRAQDHGVPRRAVAHHHPRQQGVRELDTEIGFLSASQYEQIRAMEDSGGLGGRPRRRCPGARRPCAGRQGRDRRLVGCN